MHLPSSRLLTIDPAALAAAALIASAPLAARAAGDRGVAGLSWSTYYGDHGVERGALVVTARNGGVFLAGQTTSIHGLATAHADQSSARGDWDALLVHLGDDGERRWATYFGGPDREQLHAIALDHTGAVYLVGSTRSAAAIASLTKSKTAHKAHLDGPQDGFIVKYSDRGARLWSTYFGGDGEDTIHGAAVDPDNHLYVCGTTVSDLRLSHPMHQARAGEGDAFLARFDEHGTLLWSTYYGGAGEDACLAIAAHGDRVYLTGRTTSHDRIATGHAAQAHHGGAEDAFLAVFDDRGARLWSTYHGGRGHDRGEAIAVDLRRDIYLAGTTNSRPSVATDDDLFLAKYNHQGQRQWILHYGGDGDEARAALAIRGGSIILGGDTDSDYAIASHHAAVPELQGPRDLFYVEYTRHGARRHATYFGGADHEHGVSLAFRGDRELYLAGSTRSHSQIATEDAHDEILSGATDLLLARIDLDAAPIVDPPLVAPPAPTATCDPTNHGDPSLALLFSLTPLALRPRRATGSRRRSAA